MIFAHIYGTDPLPTSFVLPFVVRHSNGKYATTLVAYLPKVKANWGFITGISLKLNRTFRYKGRQHHYLSASCPAPNGVDVGRLPLREGRIRLRRQHRHLDAESQLQGDGVRPLRRAAGCPARCSRPRCPSLLPSPAAVRLGSRRAPPASASACRLAQPGEASRRGAEAREGPAGLTRGLQQTRDGNGNPISKAAKKSRRVRLRSARAPYKDAVLAAEHGYSARAGHDRDYAEACARLAPAGRPVAPDAWSKGRVAPVAGRSSTACCPRPPPGSPRSRRRVRSSGCGSKATGRFVIFHAPGARLWALPLSNEGGGAGRCRRLAPRSSPPRRRRSANRARALGVHRLNTAAPQSEILGTRQKTQKREVLTLSSIMRVLPGQASRLPPRARTVSREQASADQRERIILAGAALIAKRGFHGTTIELIIRRAKVGYATFYKNFADKEELLLAIFDYAGVEVRRRMRAAIRGSRRLLDRPGRGVARRALRDDRRATRPSPASAWSSR